MFRSILSCVVMSCLFAVVSHPASSNADDDAAGTLVRAKQEYMSTAMASRAAVIEKVKAVENKLANNSAMAVAEKVKALEQLKSESDAFEQFGAMPKLPSLNAASRKYKEEMRAARKKIEAAFDKAADDFNKQKDLISAANVLEQKAEFQRRMAAMEEPKWFTITCPASGKLIGVSEGSLNRGALLIQWEAAKLADQVWQLVPVDDEWFLIKNRKSGFVMGIPAGSDNDGTEVIQWPYADVQDQHWKLIPVKQKNSTAVLIQNRKSGKLLSLELENSDNGIKIVQYKQIDGALHQQWVFGSVE